MSNALHVMPVGDLIEHNPSENCPCGPSLEAVPRDDGSTGWIHVHHSLDGRKAREEAAAVRAGVSAEAADKVRSGTGDRRRLLVLAVAVAGLWLASWGLAVALRILGG